ncbi:rhodanese-like domain-containing protein [Chitinophaga sp.]|uniref:rhodanese-like domain-containing protein n=1 Tax=Chitinophaga sp. TaxID=1869181 RepID=UPI002F92EC78
MRNLIIAGSILLVLYIGYRVYRYCTLDKGLGKLVKEGAVILDVRTPQEFEMEHIKGSINISLGTIRERYVELDSSKTYITVCSHGLRSVKAESILKERGFKHVYNGGAWSDLQKTLSTSLK